MEKERNPLWDEKYVMPSISDKDFMKNHRNSNTPVFLFVSKSDKKYFDQWALKYHFRQVKQLLNGTIYVMTSGEDVPESFKEAREQMKEEIPGEPPG